MPYETWPAIITPPLDGEAVNHEVTSRAHRLLAQRTEFLKSRLEDYSTKNGRILISDVLVEQSVNLGDAVYYDMGTSSYAQAIAEGTVNAETGLYEASKRSFAIGICVAKRGNYGDILVYGLSNIYEDFGIDPVNLFDRASSYKPNGTRAFLSSLIPGKLTSRPTSPVVQIGLFGSSKSYVNILQKDIFESHLHYRFAIPTKPAASQNADSNGVAIIDDKIYINYFSSTDAQREDPLINISIRKSASPSPYGTFNPARVEIRRSMNGSTMEVKVLSGPGLDINNPNSIPSPLVLEEFSLNWPNYGEEIEITNGVVSTGLIVQFYRMDGIYDNTLQEDVLLNSWQNADVYKIFLPDDLVGWTNASNLDISAPSRARYKLIHESIDALSSVWPPTPLSSVNIETGGIARLRNLEFVATNFGVYWTSSVPPWVQNLPISPADQIKIANGEQVGTPSSYVTSEVLSSPPQTFLFFSKTSLENSRSVVLSLGSNNDAIKLTDCFTNKPAQSGHLRLDLDLSLNEQDQISSSFVSYSGINPANNKFTKTSVVSNIVAGLGISVAKLGNTPGTSANCGNVMISAKNMKFEGVIDVVSLVNAKEDLVNDLVPVIWFLKPNTGSYKMVSRIKVPNDDVTSPTVSVVITPSVVGSASSASGDAVMNLTSYVLKDGVSLMSPGVPTFNQLVYSFNNYTGYTLMSPISKVQLIGNASPGDQIYTVWERVPGSLTTDTYDGNLGISQVHWEIQLN